MRFFNLIFGLALVLLLTNCKKGDSEEVQDKVNIIVTALVPKDDTFQVFYDENSSINFHDDQSRIVGVIGNPEPKAIVFSLPNDAVPSSLRIDIGGNKDQGKIVLHEVTVNYYDKSLVIKGGKEFLKYFQSDNVTVEDVSDASITLSGKTVDGVYDPMFYPKGELINALKKVIK